MNAKKTDQDQAAPAVQPTDAVAEAVVRRRKIGRGNMRRILRASEAFDKAIVEFSKAIDPEIFLADEDGNRLARWPVLDGLDQIRDGISKEVNYILYPETRPAEPDEDPAEQPNT